MMRAMDRVIAHVDMDAFYASVEIRDDPALRGRPVVVGARSARGVVAAASYEARRFGIHSAMPMVRALKACPDLVVIPPRIGHYAAVSERIFSIFERFTPTVEGLSLDEAFLDLTGTERLHGPAMVAVARLRQAIREELDLPASAGIAPVKFVAKILSGAAKPNGQRELRADELLAFLHPLPVGALWGVGEKRERELLAMGYRTIGDLARADPSVLRVRLGREAADHLIALAHADDPREVIPDREAKSIGAEETFEHDISDFETISTYLLFHAERVATRLRRGGLAARGVTLKYKLSDFRLVTRQTTLPPTADGPTLHRAALALLEKNPPGGPIRLVGLSAHHLGPPTRDLLADHAAAGRRDRLNAALDGIRDKHGAGSLVRAKLLELDRSGPRPGYVAPRPGRRDED